MEKKQGQEQAIVRGDRLQPYENEWVALDADHEVIAHDAHLTDLIANLDQKQLAKKPSFLQVLPHNVSFVSRV